ncbi:hypothetical protein [Photobacterium arenosum]|uniref:hypothetical protein n=1 Tax=Photobacterium arenosum TaxID=2774143 RepID=UPI00288B3CD2|nr:hypothetical protein [Photobacterium arenosum]
MSVTVSLNASILIALGLNAGSISLFAYAGIVPATPLTPQQLEQVYQPADAVTTFSAVPSDNSSVAFLVNQIELATALGRDDIVESALERLLAIDKPAPGRAVLPGTTADQTKPASAGPGSPKSVKSQLAAVGAVSGAE